MKMRLAFSMLLVAVAICNADARRIKERQKTIPPVEMKVTDPPAKDALHDFKESKRKTLYEFTNEGTYQDPCVTECSECPDLDSPGFEPASLAIGGYPCLCNKKYREVVKAGDYRVRFDQADLPYEFLLAGAAGQTHAVQRAVMVYFLRTVNFVLAAGFASPAETSKDWVGNLLSGNTERGVSRNDLKMVLRKLRESDSEGQQLQALSKLDLNSRSLLSAVYPLLATTYKALNKITVKESGGSIVLPDNVRSRLDEDFLFLKKEYTDRFCHEDQSKDSPCDFHAGVQMDKQMHEEHNFSQPFDGWFEWRFISKKNDPEHPAQKGPFTPGFKDSLPDMNKVHVTKAILNEIGLPLDSRYAEQEKVDHMMREHHGNSWQDENAVLPVGAGITWWEQFDCDCSPLTCQPPEGEPQLCEGGFNRVAGRVGGRSVAGPSGTTQKMLQNARLLKMSAPDLYLLRAGIMSWMVPFEDHSLLEIFMGAEDTGLPYPHDSRMYSVKALLPGEELQAASEEMTGHLQILHKRFKGLNFDASEGPGALCKQ